MKKIKSIFHAFLRTLRIAHMTTSEDAYAVWAKHTNFRGFAADKDYYQVVAEVDGTDNPLKIETPEGQWPAIGLQKTCATESGDSVIYTGIIEQSALDKLKRLCSKLELNVPRYNTGTPAGGGGGADISNVPLGKRVMAIIDFGCPFAHRQFWDAWQETTRVRYFWDQDADRNIQKLNNKSPLTAYWFPNKRFRYGRETTSQDLKPMFQRCMKAGVLDEEMAYELADYPEMLELASHGAHVMDLAAGRINPMSGLEDSASDCDIIFVQLPKASVKDTSGGSMTMYVLDALQYILDKTKGVERLVINMSFGSTAGPHDGTSLLERGMDCLIVQERTERAKAETKGSIELVLPAGNHFLADLHGQVTLKSDKSKGEFKWEINPDDPTENYLELWCAAGTNLIVELMSPSGATLKLDTTDTLKVENQSAYALIRSTNSANGAKEMVLVVLAPTRMTDAVRAESGIWKVTVSVPNGQINVVVDAWVERDDPMPWQSGQSQCRLLSSRADRQIDDKDSDADVVKRTNTGNSLACGKVPIVVGAYVVNSRAKQHGDSVVLSAFSAAPHAWRAGQSYLAPSDENDGLTGILAAGNKNNDLVRMNGTSVAAPQIARQLLNDPQNRRIHYPAIDHSCSDIGRARGQNLPRAF